jgi:PilZ domain
MDGNRFAPRRRIFKAGTIDLGDGGGIDCIVKNISETGAAIEVVSPLFIPDHFTLHVSSAQLKRRCRIVWRRDKRIGVAFD